MFDAFLRYLLVDEPGAFFDSPLRTQTDTEETTIDHKKQQHQSIEAYRKRALALVTLLKKRREFNCNKLRLMIGTKDRYSGFLPVTELNIKDRSFTFDPLEA